MDSAISLCSPQNDGTPAAALSPKWPVVGYIEGAANSNRDIYSGDFKDGLYHGTGILHWRNDEFL
ncbi:MAG: hypothetical protein LBK67_12995 [Coriobacteriales bacterium]|nr:hypothetical protein [Coriobacteriales bacterium]